MGKGTQPSVRMRRRSSSWPAYAAALWAFVFAATSFYWAAGGTVGEGTIAADLDEAGVADPLLLAATGALKVIAGLMALALVWSTRPIPDRWSRRAAWAVAALVLVYGAVSLLDHLLMELGARSTPDALGPTALRWHLAMWDPLWLLGGVLFAAAAWTSHRDQRQRARAAARRRAADQLAGLTESAPIGDRLADDEIPDADDAFMTRQLALNRDSRINGERMDPPASTPSLLFDTTEIWEIAHANRHQRT